MNTTFSNENFLTRLYLIVRKRVELTEAHRVRAWNRRAVAERQARREARNEWRKTAVHYEIPQTVEPQD